MKVIWTREEDIRHDIVRPMYYDRISAILGSDGRPVWYGDHITSATVLARWMPEAMGKDGMDDDVIECAAETPYSIPNLDVNWARHDMPAGLEVGWWRGVGPTHNLFVIESFMDELAHAAGKDPLDYRRVLLAKDSRALGVLELAAQKIGWGSGTCPARVGRGIALGSPFGSHVCLIVEAEVTPQGEVRLRRAVAAIDCGIAINPSSIEAQVQGGLLFGLSAALYSAHHPEGWRVRAEQLPRLPQSSNQRGAADRGLPRRKLGVAGWSRRGGYGHRRTRARQCHLCRDRGEAAFLARG